MPTEALTLKQEFSVSAISSIHFFEYKSDFIFKSEYHDCWKLLYVEEGACDILRSGHESSPITLEKGQLYIQAPHEYYSFKAAQQTTPLLFTCGFYCDSTNMSLLAHRIFHCGRQELRLLSDLSEEGRSNFSVRVDDSALYSLERKLNQPFGGEQLNTRSRVDASDQSHASVCLSFYQKRRGRFLPFQGGFYPFKQNYRLLRGTHFGKSKYQPDLPGVFHRPRSFTADIPGTDRTGRHRILLPDADPGRQTADPREQNESDRHRPGAGLYIHPLFFQTVQKITGMPPSQYQNSIRTAGSDPVCQHIDLDQKELISKAPADTDPHSF